MKKLISILIACMLLMSIGLSAAAEGSTPPSPPEGGMGGTPPDMPEGGMGGTPPDMPEGGMGGTPPDMPEGGMGGTPPGMPGGSSSADLTYTAAVEITASETQADQTYTSDTVDESALIINTDGSVTIENPTVTKTGSSTGGDNCNFYGLNAAVLAMGGGQNGAEGDGTTVVISDTVITTTGSGSGGIMTTGGGITYASNLTVTTSGGSSAPIRTDRGGGTVVVDGGTYTSNGLGSPAIYSTADITVSNAELVSNLSEGVCIEGLNSITLNNCSLTANNTKCNGNATFLDSIMIYQSMSGDADSGTSSFTMTDGTLRSMNGHIFHVTNTHAVIRLSNVTLINEDEDNVLISVCDDGWSGADNTAEFYADAQALSGAVLVGSDSSLTLNLTNGSTLEGYVSGNITNSKGNVVSTEAGTVSVTLDETSTWTLTADSYITEFNGSAANVISNGYTLYVNGTALEGVTE